MSSKTEMLNELLVDLSKASQGNVQASLIISKSQGLTICSHFPENIPKDTLPDEDVIAGRSTQIDMATRKVFKQLKRGELTRMLVEGESGYVIISNAGDDALLAVLTNKKVNLGFIFFMMSRIASRIEKIL
ncbi:MAG: roadblock/LC7 domain-containing protein [Candidatus Thorarchaeota archaeon]|nr:roadblock/LC7 domain-containing protein [Candidatus Thorarchaeota archaeon]